MFHSTLLKYSFINRLHSRMTREQIKKMQLKKFHALVQFVSGNSPYYQEVIKKNKIDIGNCKPEDFPILTKETLIERFDDIVTDRRITKRIVTDFLSHSHDPLELFLNKYYVIHTSGSSGTVGYFIYTQEELIRGIIHFSRIKTPSMGQKMAYIAATKGHYAGVTMASIAKLMPFLYKDVQMFDINMPFSEIITRLQKFQPTALGGYAFAIRKLAEAQRAGNLAIKPQIIQSGGEPLSNRDKEYIEEVFNIPVVNIYAASEYLIIGIGKDEYDGMYLMEDDLIFELYENYTCVTNLFNYTLPLIRYQMNDRLEKVSDPLHKLPFTKVADLVGRKEHVPVFVNDKGEEDFISPILLAEFYVKNLASFQFHLLNKRSFIFKATLEKGLDKHTIEKTKQAIAQELKKILAEKNMTKVTFIIEIVDHLWVHPKTGKFQLIVKK